MQIDKLMFKRTDFPLTVRQGGILEVRTMPPHHPKMQDGIPFDLGKEAISLAVRDSVLDLKDVTRVSNVASYLLTYTTPEQQEGRIDPQIETLPDGRGVVYTNLPLVGEVFIGRLEINPFGPNGDQGIRIELDPRYKPNAFVVPKTADFSPELKREYGMGHESDYFTHGKSILCTNLFVRHNLAPVNALFYKNLVVALDNAFVRKIHENANAGE